MLRGERLELRHTVGPTVFQFSHNDSLSVGKSGEVRLHRFTVCDRVLGVVAEQLLAVGGFVLGNHGNALVALESASDVGRVLLELGGEREIVEDVGQRRAFRELFLKVVYSEDHMGHNLRTGLVSDLDVRRWGSGGV